MGRKIFTVIREAMRRYFVAGMLVFAPIGITIWATAWIIQRLDNLLLPAVIRMIMPGIEDPPRLPFVGALFTLLVIILLGVIARHLFGGEMVKAWERLLSRVPVARNIYGGVKQLFEAIFTADQRSRFNRVIMIEYPRRGVYALAFTTGTAQGKVQAATEKTMINCFLPTTPNPTSGFYLLVPEDEVNEIDMTVEEAFKLVMSAGLVAPEDESANAETPSSETEEDARSAPSADPV
jgi:uncharacterized membrane protein